jgi:hypothetical protein
MSGNQDYIAPIMTKGLNTYQFGNNAYGKPATALNILRETVMGRELFDYAFKEYAHRWMFKHPTPEDLFRTMEDASAVDLDWFWRGWFFTNDHVDIAITGVKEMEVKLPTPEEASQAKMDQKEAYKRHIGYQRNLEMQTIVKQDSNMRDFYNSYNPDAPTDNMKRYYDMQQDMLSVEQKERYNSGKYAYEVSFENIGGLVMPIILEVTYEDGSTEAIHIPAEVWLRNEEKFSKVFVFNGKVKKIEMDPFYEMADTDRSNNFWPSGGEPSRFESFQQERYGRGENPMQRQK